MAQGVEAASGSEGKLLAAHDALMRASDLQHAFGAAPRPAPTPPWVQPLVRALIAAGPVLKIVFWGGLALGAALVLWLVIRDLPFARWLRRKPKPPASPSDWRPEAQAARALLIEADALAQAGRYAEAAHLLLFRSLEDIAARRPEAVRAALTSREIVGAAPLSDRGRAALRAIAAAVEHSFFGGRPLGRAEFEGCRREYEAFALVEAAP